MNKNIVISLVIVAVLAVGGYFLYQGINRPASVLNDNQAQNQPANQESTPTDENQPNDTQTVMASKTYEVIYTDSGYSPSTITIKEGDTVIFKNQSNGGIWTASAMHPTHVIYSGTSLQQHCPDLSNTAFDQCKNEGPGTSWPFTFSKKGTWGYHNHASAGKFGKVIVE